MTRPFHLESTSTDAGGLDLRPRGLLWAGTNTRLGDGLVEAIEADSGAGPVTVSLDRSTAIDAATAAAIATGRDAARRDGRDFAVSNPPRGAEIILGGLGVPVLVNGELFEQP